jgi:hypothetical protein
MTDESGTIPPQEQPKPGDAAPVPSSTRGGGVFFGVMLVVLGAVFLVSQFLPGFSAPWWALWPLIIVVAGVVQVFTPGSSGWGVDRVFEGLGTVIFGLILLGNTTGSIAWSVWWVVITLWPALVIALGLTILAKGLSLGWLRIVATLVVWITLAYAVAVSWTGLGLNPPTAAWTDSGEQASFSEPGVGVKDASLQLKGGAGDIRIGSGRKLVTVYASSVYGSPTFATGRNGASAWVRVGLTVSKPVVLVPGTTGARIDARLSDTALWDIALDTGAASIDADLSDVRVHDAELTTGVGAVAIKLGKVPGGERKSTLVVKSGVSSVRILLPRGAEARVEGQNALVATDVGSRFVRNAGTWETPGYSSASKTWEIRTEAGVGSVSVDTY